MAVTWNGSQPLLEVKQSPLQRLPLASKEGFVEHSQLSLLPISPPPLPTQLSEEDHVPPHPRSPGGGTSSSPLRKESLPEKNWLME